MSWLSNTIRSALPAAAAIGGNILLPGVGGIIGSSLASGFLGNEAARAASDASAAATNATIGEQRRQYDQTRADQAPFRQAGYDQLGALQQGLNDQGQPLPQYQSTPMYNAFQGGQAPDQYQAAPAFNFDPSQLQNSRGYQFGLNQGIDAVNAGAAKSGNLNSGNRLLALQQFGQDYASTKYGEEYNRQFGANQDAYNRGVSTYGLNYDRNNNLYNRGVSEYGLGQQRNQDQYNRNLTGFQADYQRNQDAYGRGQNVLNRRQQVAGFGQTSLAQTGAAGANAGNRIGDAYGSNAANQINASNVRYGSMNSAIQGGLGNYLTRNYLNQRQQSGYGFNPQSQLMQDSVGLG